MIVRRRTRATTAVVLGRIDLVRALGRAGIGSVVAVRPGDPMRHSRHVTGTIDADPTSLADALVGYAAGRAHPPPLFYDSDESLLFVSRNRERLGAAYRFVLPEAELVEDLLDKGRFQALARALELPTPPTHRLTGGVAADVEQLGLRFPLVIKASPYRDSRWDGVGLASKVLRVDDSGALRGVLERIDGAGIDVIAQELVPGPENRVESYHVYVDGGGAVAAEFTGRKIRTSPPEFGMSTALVTTDDADLAAAGRDVVERLGFRGVAKLDFKRAPDGRLHLLEVNPRFTLWAHVGAVAGVNLPAIVHADLTGRPRPAPARARPGVRWIWPHGDADAARASGISLAAWLLWAARAETNSSFALSDPLPYLVRKLHELRGRGAG